VSRQVDHLFRIEFSRNVKREGIYGGAYAIDEKMQQVKRNITNY
jgi:hypothetical protein